MSDWEFQIALARFKEATATLSRAWENVPGDVLTGYPEYLPSFDEFAVDVLGIEAPSTLADYSLEACAARTEQAQDELEEERLEREGDEADRAYERDRDR